MAHLCYIGLGSNLNQPCQQVQQAIRALANHSQLELVAYSSLYSSQPMGPQDQNDYINAVVCIKTQLTPLELLAQTQAIETLHGRERKDERWGPRTLDLDILLYDKEIITSDKLTLPHYGLKEREFVLYPLYEIAPNLILPDQERLKDLVAKVSLNGLKIWQKATDLQIEPIK